ncbi:MAG: glycogen/starch synthase [Thiovulaceae bacterium]|nr:glycogen/starch synthase [Sulfurimonadaceae bacterium]
MKILFASSEIFPYAKSGGLADVADALPRALSSYTELYRVIPLYGFMSKKDLQLSQSFEVSLGNKKYKINLYTKLQNTLNLFFLEAPLLSETQNLYCDKEGDYVDNDLRFAIFCKAVVALAVNLHVDILHLNDWHTSLCALFAKEQKLALKTVLTIHNLAYQGIFEKETLARLGISEKYFTMDSLEFYGKVNFLKAGIAYSDAVTTVSPSYAKEILTSEFGCGLEGFLTHHKAKLSGILNGINEVVFDPRSDKIIYTSYENIEGKYQNKVALLKTSKLKDPRKPLFVMITRLVEQKGIDLVLESMEKLLQNKLNLFIIGEGEARFTEQLQTLCLKHENFEFFNGYDEVLSHQLYAAADFLLMPSRFEPCGLNQMIAMRYGTIPIVHATGGLKDSVHEDRSKCGQGILFNKQSKQAFLLALKRALMLKKERKQFEALVSFNMQCDFSFEQSALAYLKIYESFV